MLRALHCLDNGLTDGSEVVSLMYRLRSVPQKHFLYHFSQRRSKSEGLVWPEGLGDLVTFSYVIGSLNIA
jgi:hypothetical protein